jgi:uncharacterized protein (TIGR02246 family)
MRNLLIVTAVVCGLALPALAGKGNAKDEAAIKALCTSFDEAWNKGDAKAMGALFVPDGNMISPTGELIQGRAGVEQKFGTELASQLKGTTHKITVNTLYFIKPDVAMGEADVEMANVKGPGGKAMPPVRVKGTGVFVKQAGKWMFFATRAYIHVPPQAATATRK